MSKQHDIYDRYLQLASKLTPEARELWQQGFLYIDPQPEAVELSSDELVEDGPDTLELTSEQLLELLSSP